MNMKKMVLPNNLECYYLAKEETEFIFSEIFTEQQYFSNKITINEGDCIFDVGANIGLFSIFLSQLQKHAKIFSFEPVKPIFDVLRANVELHSIADIYLFNYGVSSENNSNILFTFYPNMAGNSTAVPLEKLESREVMNTIFSKDIVEKLFQSQEIRGEVKTLSSIFHELDIKSVDLLKIDVEGEEYAVLQGINPNDWSKIKQIVMEVHDIEGRIAKIQKLLKTYGFQVRVEKNSLIPDAFNNFNLYAVRG